MLGRGIVGTESERGGETEMVESSEETLMVLHNRCGSNRNLVKRIIFSMVDDDILSLMNCYGKTNTYSKRKNVRAIDPLILAYALRRTVELCRVSGEVSNSASHGDLLH